MQQEWKRRTIEICRHTDTLLAIGVMALVFVLILPLPPFLLDTLLSMSLVFSVMVLLLTLYVENALEFSSFPSVLLFLTLFRLGLNIASTRLILTQGEAGDIIHTFGEFVIGENVLIGMVLFLLLTAINFLVVTKGANRIAEVAARFTLEALPGKQIAIDSELSTGLISQEYAKKERKKLAAEADFYGAMDGASKFVRGDAIAGLAITGVNIVGGLLVGLLAKGLSWGECGKTMTRLAIGDGLVSQVPALLVSLGAALMVTRASSGAIGKKIPQEIFRQPRVAMLAAAILFCVGFLPGMPLLLMASVGGLLFLLGYAQHYRQERAQLQQSISPYVLTAPLEIHLGYELFLYTTSLQHHLHTLRQKIGQHLGFSIPYMKITEKVELAPTEWRLLVRGIPAAQEQEGDLALLLTRVERALYLHAHALINRQDVAHMLQAAKEYDGAVVEELYPKKLHLGQILKVLQSLLREGIPIGDFTTILEVLADHASGETSDIESLTEEVRERLAGKISETFFGREKNAYVITIDPKVEQMLIASKGSLRPRTHDHLVCELTQLYAKGRDQGIHPVVITIARSRAMLRRLIEKQLPQLPILSYQEVASDITLTPFGEISTQVLSV